MFHPAQHPGDAGGEPLVMPAMLPVMSSTWVLSSDSTVLAEEVLREELGLGPAQIQKLHDAGVCQGADSMMHGTRQTSLRNVFQI